MSLDGRFVCVYIDGGFVLEGQVIKSDKEAIFVESEGEVYMVFKIKVSAVKFSTKKENSVGGIKPADDSLENANQDFPQNGLSYDDNMASIPMSMLNKDFKPKDDDFSVFFGSGNKSGNLNFKTKRGDDGKAD
jgi:sRNA-binding regulator protein Hfq